MKTVKKILLLLAVLCLFAAFATGCGKDDGDNTVYTVNFDLSCTVDGQEVWVTVDGKREVESISMRVGNNFLDKLPTVDEPPAYYSFVGWYYISGDTQIRITESLIFDPTVFTGITDEAFTLQAVCELKDINIKFDLSCQVEDSTVYSTVNGKSEVASPTIRLGETFTGKLPQIDERADEYKFVGWYYHNGAENIQVTQTTEFNSAVFSDVADGSITLHAVCEKRIITVKYDLDYEIDGQTVELTVNGDRQVADEMIEVGETFTGKLPQVDETDGQYRFSDWYYIAGSTVIKVTEPTVLNLSVFKGIEEDTIVLQAVCIDKADIEYTVSFNLSSSVDGNEIQSTVNGQTQVATVIIKSGETFSGKLPQVDARNDKYEFVGWYYVSGDIVIAVTEETGFEPSLFSGIENDAFSLTAVCKNRQLTVIFDLSTRFGQTTVWSTVNGASFISNAILTDGNAFASIIPELDARPADDDYYFEGWYYMVGEEYVPLQDEAIFTWEDFATVVSGNTLILQAVLEAKAITVKFNLAYEIDGKTVYSTVGGETSVPDAKIADGMTFGSILPEVDTRPLEDDYYFAGWYYVVGGTSIKIESDTVFTRAQFFGGGSDGEITLVARLGRAWIGPY